MIYTKEQLEAMSDAQLNIIITQIEDEQDYSQWALTADETKVYHCGVDGSQYHSVDIYDYCTGYEYMMPLVFEVGISLVKVSDGYVAFGDDYGYLDNQGSSLSIHETDDPLDWSNEAVGHANPLRACAIVYILVKQS